MIFSARQLKIRREEQNVFSKQDCEISCFNKKKLKKLQKIQEMVKTCVSKLKIHADKKCAKS